MKTEWILQELRSRRRSDLTSAAYVLMQMGLALGPAIIAAALAPEWPCLIALAVVSGIGLNGSVNMLHETAHRLVFKRKEMNNLLGYWLLGPMLGTDFGPYRERHWKHHKHLGSSDDPKLSYRRSIRGGRFVILIVEILSGLLAVRKWLFQFQSPLEEQPAEGEATDGSGFFIRFVLFQMGLLGGLLLASNSAGYGITEAALAYGVYLYGLIAVTVLLAELRGLEEHQQVSGGEWLEGEAVLRNLSCNPLTRLLFGSWGFGEHAAHHLDSAVPAYHLKELSARMSEEDSRYLHGVGYLTILARAVAGKGR